MKIRRHLFSVMLWFLREHDLAARNFATEFCVRVRVVAVNEAAEYNLAEEEVTSSSPRRAARHKPHVCARSVGDAGPPGPYGERRNGVGGRREEEGTCVHVRGRTATKEGGWRERESTRRGRERVGGGRAARSSRPRRQLPTDLSSGTCRSGAMSFCTFLLSAESSASPRGQKVPQDRRPAGTSSTRS